MNATFFFINNQYIETYHQSMLMQYTSQQWHGPSCGTTDRDDGENMSGFDEGTANIETGLIIQVSGINLSNGQVSVMSR